LNLPAKLLDTPKKRSIALILSPIGLLLISAGRLIIVSDYNTTTAVTIASSGGYINTLLGSVIPLVAIFAPYLALLLLLLKRFLLSLMVFAFAAFITPSPISMPEVLSLAKADWHQFTQLVLSILGHQQILYLALIVVLSVVLIGPLWEHHREIAEVAAMTVFMVVIVALLAARSSEPLLLPTTLRLARATEGQNEHQLITLTTAYWPLAIAIGLSLIFLASTYSSIPKVLSAAVAIIATFALFPYVSAIYPVPSHGNYYSEVLHELWLPAEKIVLNSGHVRYGYILASDPTWDTVLLTNRKIVYLRADDVVHRSVCQPKTTPEPAPYPPLIPLLYTKPSPTPACAPSSNSATITSIRVAQDHG
jgi:hypothetical protein